MEGTGIPSSTVKHMKLIPLSQTEGSHLSQIQGTKMEMGHRDGSQPIQHNRSIMGILAHSHLD